MFGDNFFYILYFQEPGPADAELARDPATTMRRMMAPPTPDGDAAAMRMLAPGPEGFIDRMPEPGRIPPWLEQDEFDHYVTEFTNNGFTGPLNWYRCFDRNWELTANPPGVVDHRACAVRRGFRGPNARVHAARPSPRRRRR